MSAALTLESSVWSDWVQALVTRYRFSEDQLSPGLDRLAVFRDSSRRIPLALVKKQDRPDVATLDDVRRNGYQLLVCGAPARHTVWGLGDFDDEPELLPGLPTWMPRHPRDALVDRSTTLLPFRAEDDLREAFRACHDAIYKALANDPAASFDLVMLTLAAKVLDEDDKDFPTYNFSLVRGEPASESAQRLGRLLRRAKTWLDGHDAGSMSHDELPPALAERLLRLLQDYSFRVTAASATGTDVLGTAYESIVGSTFRGELGSYFTPRTMTDFMARLLNIRTGRVLDPACGSGGLLLGVRRAATGAADLEYFGNDLNPRMVRAARVNFLLHGMDPDHVLRGNGLELQRLFRDTVGVDVDSSGDWVDAIPDGPFDAIVANPPFAGYEADPELLARIRTAQRGAGGMRGLNRTLPFIETMVSSLKLGGVAGLVLPTSILNAEEDSFVRLRSLLLQQTEVLAIIGLPEKAFVHTDCGVHGVLLFLKRVAHPRSDYNVFVDWARHLGYDRLGRYRRENDFPQILQRYRAEIWPVENSFSVQVLADSGRWDPAWLQVYRSLPQVDGNADGSEYVRLTDLLEVRDARFSRRSISDDATYSFFEVGDADIDTGRIKRVQEVSGFELRKKGRIRNRVEAGDVLLPNHRDSLIAKASPTGRSAVVVDAECDGLLTTDRFLVMRPKLEADALIAILNSAGVRRQIVAQCRGAASLDIREKTLGQVLVPRALLTTERLEALTAMTRRDSELRRELHETRTSMRELIESAFGGGKAEFRPISWMSI